MIDLTKFTNCCDVRPFCRVPIRLSTGLVAATDGVSIMVLEKKYEADADGLFPAPQNVDAVINKHLSEIDAQREWKPISSLPVLAPEPCHTCRGRGRVTIVECDECDGVGEFMNGRHYYECKECDGSGEIDCEPVAKDSTEGKQCLDCHGTGHSTLTAFMKIDGMPAGLGVDARLLSRYPADGEYALSTGDRLSILLRGDGWRGALMPMAERH